MEKPALLGKMCEELLQGWEGSLNTLQIFKTLLTKMVVGFKYMQTVQQVK